MGRDNIVTQAVEREAVKVDEVAGHVKLGDLALFVRQILRPCHPTFKEND
jgi:hypothetical protein